MTTAPAPPKPGTGIITEDQKLQEKIAKSAIHATSMAAELTKTESGTTMRIRPPKRPWSTILGNLFKGKSKDATSASILLPINQDKGNGTEVSTVPNGTVAGTVTSTSRDGSLDSSSAEGKVENGRSTCGPAWLQSSSEKQTLSTMTVEASSQTKVGTGSVAASSGQSAQVSKPVEHTINGLRSGGGNFTHCFPTTYSSKSNVRDPYCKNVHTLFFSGNHALINKTETPLMEGRIEGQARGYGNKSGKGCLPSSPKTWKAVPHGSKSKANRDDTTKPLDPPIGKGTSPGRKLRKGCFPNLGRKSGDEELENGDLRANLTYLDLDDDGNYGTMFDTGSFRSKDLTYLEFENDGRYEPSIQDSSMTYLGLDDEGKYESSVELKTNDPSVGPSGNRIHCGEQGGQKSRNKVCAKSSIASLEADENAAEFLLSPDQVSIHGFVPLPNPLPAVRQPLSQGVPDNLLNLGLNSHEMSDSARNDVELKGPSIGLHHETQYQKKGGYNSRTGIRLPTREPKCARPSKDVTLRAAFTSIELNEEVANKSSSDDAQSDPPLRDGVDGTKQKRKGGPKVRNGCLGLQSRKIDPKIPSTSTRSEDRSRDKYSADVELSDPWRGEEVAESELKDFRKFKSKKGCLPFGGNPKRGYPTSVRTEEGSDFDQKNQVGMKDRPIDEDVAETQCEDLSARKANKGCLPFGQTSKTDNLEMISPSMESDKTIDYRAEVEQEVATSQVEDFTSLKTHIDGIGTMMTSTETDDESDNRAYIEEEDCSMGNEVGETPREDSLGCKSQKGCLPFGRMLRKNLPDVILNSTELNESRDCRATIEEPKTNWDNVNVSKPKKGCLPFARKHQKDNSEQILPSIDSEDVQPYNPQMREEIVEMQWEDFSGLKPKKTCIPFGRQVKDYPGAVLTAKQEVDTGVLRADIEQNAHGIGEDMSERPLLSEWQGYSGNDREMGWFPSRCCLKKPAHSTSSGTDENVPGQVRIDLELSGSEVHRCLPCGRKSRKGKLLYVQSGECSGDNFTFDLDLDHPLTERVDENGEDEGRKRCLLPGLRSRKEHLGESLVHMEHNEKRTTGAEPCAGDLAAKRRFPCADYICTVKKQKPTHAQTVPLSGPELSIISDLTAPALEEELHGLEKTGCARLLRKPVFKKGLEKSSYDQTLLVHGPECSAVMEFIDPAPEEQEVGETGNTCCGRFERKVKSKTGCVLEGPVEEPGRTSCRRFTMERSPTKQKEEAVDGFGKDSCGRFSINRDPRNQMEETVDESGKPSCARSSTKANPRKQLEEAVDGSGKASCGRFATKQDGRSQFELELEMDESRRTSCGRSFIKQVLRKQHEEAVDKSGQTSCERFLVNQDARKQLDKAVDGSEKTACGGLSMNQDATKHCEQWLGESGRVNHSRLSTNFCARSQFDMAVDESKRTICGKLSTRGDARNQFEEGVDESGRISYGGYSKKRDPRNQCEKVVHEYGRIGCGGLSMKQGPWKQLHSIKVDEMGAENPDQNLTKSVEEKFSTPPEGLQTHNAEGAHESESSPLLNNRAHSRTGFLQRYFSCMDIDGNSSGGSGCTIEAGFTEHQESINTNSISNTGKKQKSGSGQACMRIVPEAKAKEMVASPETGHTFDCSIQANVLNTNTYGITLNNDPNNQVQQQLLTSELPISGSNSSNCSHHTCQLGQKGNKPQAEVGCGIFQMKQFGKCAVLSKEDVDFTAASQMDPTPQPHIGDMKVHVKPSSQKCYRERWTPCKRSDTKARILRPFNIRKGPGPSVPETESRTDEHSGYQCLIPETKEPTPHSCDTFRPYKMADITTSEMGSRASRRNLGDGWQHCEKIDSSGLAQNCSTKKYFGESWLQTDWNKSEYHMSTGPAIRCPENKWLRREGVEPLAKQSKTSTEEFQDDWLQDDEEQSVAQEPIPCRKGPQNNSSIFRPTGFLAQELPTSMGDYASQQHKGKIFAPQKATASHRYCFGDGYERSQGIEQENEQLKATQQPVSQQVNRSTQRYCGYALPQHELTEFETQKLTDSLPQGQTEVSHVYSSSNCYGQIEATADHISYESGYRQQEYVPDKEQPGRSPVCSNHQCLGRNWRKRQKKESVAQALEASESLLKNLLPIKLPKFETSGQEESSMSGLSQKRGTCCLMSMFPRKVRRKSKRTQTQDFEAATTSLHEVYSNQLGNEETENPETKTNPMILQCTHDSQDTFQEENSPKTLRRAKGTRRIRPCTPEPRNNSAKATEQVIPLLDSVAGLIEAPSNHADVESLEINESHSHDKPPPQQLKWNCGRTNKAAPNRAPCLPKLLTCTRSKSADNLKGMNHQAQSVSGETKIPKGKLNICCSQKKIPYLACNTSATEDSSSGEDIHGAASKKFRNDLSKTQPRKNCLVTKSASSLQTVALNSVQLKDHQKVGKSQQQLLKDPGTLSTLFQKLENSDQFCRSPVFQELVKVESQMREIAKIITGLTGPDYQEPGKDLDDQVVDYNGGGLKTEDEQIHKKHQVSVYRNPLWFAEWQEPVSVQMATRLAGDEVPVYYEDGFKVGYIPVGCRGSRGMRKRKPTEWLDKEYSKFTNREIKETSDDDDNHEIHKRHPRKRFSQKFTAKGLLHEKTHPHDHRSSVIQEAPTSSTHNYSSSSSSWSWKEDLIQSHRRVFCQDKEAMSLRRKTEINSEDSDSTDSFSSTECEKPDAFMEQVDEELARLKIAKMQLTDLSSGPVTAPRMSLKLNGDFNEGGGIRMAPDSGEESHSDLSEVRPAISMRGKSAKNCARFEEEYNPNSSSCLGRNGGYNSKTKCQEGSPNRTQRAIEDKEFQLLERRVRKELGGKRKIKSAKPAQHPKEEMSALSEQLDKFRSQDVSSLDEYHSKSANPVDMMTPPSVESNLEIACGETPSGDPLNGPVSSLVKLMFGTQKIAYDNEGRQEPANKIHAAETIIQKKVGILEAEILNFKEDNRRLRIMMKDNAEHTSRLMREKSAWELQKHSDMDAFQQYKEAQMNKLQKERCKMEHQTRVLMQLPKKEERKEIEDLKAKLAEEHDAHIIKELQWRQTSNRLHGVNKNLKDEIHELRKEIGRHEDRLLLEMAPAKSDSDSTVQPSRENTRKTWNTNTFTDSDSTAQHSQEKARRKAQNRSKSMDEISEGLHPTKVKVKLTKKPQHPPRVSVEVIKKPKNHDAMPSSLLKEPSTSAKDTLSSCEDATTALAKKMKHLEREVEQWINVHAQQCDRKPGPHP